jgi:hypothetical protein
MKISDYIYFFEMMKQKHGDLTCYDGFGEETKSSVMDYFLSTENPGFDLKLVIEFRFNGHQKPLPNLRTVFSFDQEKD